MRQRMPSRLWVGWLAVLCLVVAACAPEGAQGTTTIRVTTTTAPTSTVTTEATTTTTPIETGLVVYLLLDELEGQTGGPFLVPVFRPTALSDNLAQQAVELLVEGPSQDETEGIPSISTAIPEGTQALGGSVDNGVATVNLSGEYDDGGGSFSMLARLAQVVYTLTAIPDIEAVNFELDGEPVEVFSADGIGLDEPQQRDDYYDLLPAIFVDSPAWGEPVTSPVQVRGLSNVFEAVHQIMLTDDDGLPQFEDFVMATCGTGCWGTWEIEIPYTLDRPQFGALIVWEFSAEDGSRIHIREYPVQLR